MEINMKERIGEKIRTLRQKKMMTQSDLAGDRITRSMLSLIEHGNSEPSLSSLSYLAERLRVSPAFLVAEPTEEEMYRRQAKIRDVRIAYKAEEYRICFDLCREIDLPEDDELNLISAECAIGMAIEEITKGSLHGVGAYLEKAMMYAEKTGYRSGYIFAEAAVLSRYLGRFSEIFYSDIFDAAERRGIPLSAASENPFCTYALMLFLLDETNGSPDDLRIKSAEMRTALRVSAPFLADHAEILLLLHENSFADALKGIDALFSAGEKLPMPILYELFRDREICARETGDYKGAYEAASAKQELLSRILSEP